MAKNDLPTIGTAEQLEAQGLLGAGRMVGEWLKAKPSPRKLYEEVKLDENGQPVIGPDGNPVKVQVRNALIDPKYGYRTEESPPLTLYEAGSNVINNWHPLEVARDAVKGLADAPQGLVFLDSIKRGAFAVGMTPEQYRDTFFLSGGSGWQSGLMPMGFNPFAPTFVDPVDANKMDLETAEKRRQEDLQNYKRALALYGVYNPKTKELSFDWNGFARDLTQHPAEVGSLFVGGGAGFTKAASGVAKLSGLENGLSLVQNLSRLKNTTSAPFSGTSSAMQAVRDFGTVAGDVVKSAAASKFGKGLTGALDVTGKALSLTGKGLDPVMPILGNVTGKAIETGVNTARQVSPYKVSIYSPEFNREWGAFQKAEEQKLIDSGAPAEQIISIPTQRGIWEQFQAETGDKFNNPFSKEANAAFDALEEQGRGFKRENYAPPYIGGVIDQTINRKGKGITPAILAEGAIRTAAPEGGGLTGVPARNTKDAIGITRSTATNEPPGILQQNKGMGQSGLFSSNREAAARTSTTNQLGDYLSENLGGQGANPVTYQDIAEDFIRADLEKRNAYQWSYDKAAETEGGGVYTDPDAFVTKFQQEYDAALRKQGLSAQDVAKNPSLFPNSAASFDNSIKNIGGYGQTVEPLTATIPGINTTYTYNPAIPTWIDTTSGKPALPDLVRYLNQENAASIAAGQAPPRNMLNLQNLEIERRRLNAVAQKAYQSGNMGDYKAAMAQVDALDNTAIDMAPTHNGPKINEAINHLAEARSEFRNWRQNGIDAPPTPANDIVRTAAQRTFDLTQRDPATGRFVFSGEPDAATYIGDVFKDKFVGEKGVTPSYQDPNALVDVLTDPNRGLMTDPTLVKDYIRTGYGQQGASPQDLAAFHGTYGNRNLLSPDEANFFERNLAAQAATNPNAIPQREPFKLVRDLDANMGVGQRIYERAKPLIRGTFGFLAGNTIDPTGTLGYLAGTGALGSGPASRGAADLGLLRNELGGAPKYSVNIPQVAVNAPLRASGVVAGYQDAQQTAQNESEANAILQDQIMAEAKEMLGPPPTQQQPQPQPQAHGGRAAYRAGGKVGGIEPLIQALMNKAKMAKKVSNKATEPLLNERDDAIASALAVAQKAI
jgi:hypothetical protein